MNEKPKSNRKGNPEALRQWRAGLYAKMQAQADRLNQIKAKRDADVASLAAFYSSVPVSL